MSGGFQRPAVEITPANEHRIVSLYVEHGLTLKLLTQRFGGSQERIKAVLEKHNVKLRCVRTRRA